MTGEEIKSRAEKIKRVELLERDLREVASSREIAERHAAQFEPGGELQRKAMMRFAERTVLLTDVRRALAQAVFDLYGVGVDKNGAIIWESNQS
jgi:hypothetical protein